MWKELKGREQLEEILNASGKQIVVFKHSTRCGISSMALSRFEKNDFRSEAEYYLLDLIRFREISNAIAEISGVMHESPQILLFRNGQCVYNASHSAIRPSAIPLNSAVSS